MAALLYITSSTSSEVVNRQSIMHGCRLISMFHVDVMYTVWTGGNPEKCRTCPRKVRTECSVPCLDSPSSLPLLSLPPLPLFLSISHTQTTLPPPPFLGWILRWQRSCLVVPSCRHQRSSSVHADAARVILDAGGCGACYAFAAAGAIEGAFAIHGPGAKLVPVSVQNIIDCRWVHAGGLQVRVAVILNRSYSRWCSCCSAQP